MNPKDRGKWRIAQEAARLIAEEGMHDRVAARNKAAVRLGFNPRQGMPRNEDIELALQEHLRLYRYDVQPQYVAKLRQLALEAMKFLRHYSPRLVGGVLDGSAGAYSPITIYLFPDTPEEVMGNLMDARIPFEETSMPVQGKGLQAGHVPGVGFMVDGVRVELCLLPATLKRQLGRKDGAVPGGTIEDVELLLRGLS